MKKVLVVFDGAHFPSSTLQFALDMNSREPIMLTGIFLPSIDYAEIVSYTYYGNALAPLYLENYEDDNEAIRKNVALFETFCNDHYIRYKVHQNIQKGVVQVLRKETRYADLLVLSSPHFYENLGEWIQEEYLDDTLHKTECPIVLLTGPYSVPESIIFAYDGSSSSMHALKQFIYLFPQWTDLNTFIIYADDGKEEIPFYPLIQEYAAQHFSKLGYYNLKTGSGQHLKAWIENKGTTLLISGSYGRSAFSEFLRKNFLKEIVKGHEVPLFIAHQ